LDTPISETHLDIIDSMTLGGSELSGLARRSFSNKNGIELIAVSDSSYKIQSVSFEKSLEKKFFSTMSTD
jgi:hypothetical protein